MKWFVINEGPKTLFLDDMEPRQAGFKAWAIRNKLNATGVFTAEDAIDEINNAYYKTVYLDHDLGPKSYQGIDDPKELNGQNVVKAIVALPPEKRPTLAIVHSWNMGGAKYMLEDLRAANIRTIYEPFSANKYN